MKNLSKEIKALLTDQLNLVNKKLSGLIFLEDFKYILIEKLKTHIVNIDFKKVKDFKDNLQIEDEHRIVNLKIVSNKSKEINLNTEISKNLLLISLNELIIFNIKDQKSNKNINIKCIPMTGIVLPKGTVCSINYVKNSFILELSIEDKGQLLKI